MSHFSDTFHLLEIFIYDSYLVLIGEFFKLYYIKELHYIHFIFHDLYLIKATCIMYDLINQKNLIVFHKF